MLLKNLTLLSFCDVCFLISAGVSFLGNINNPVVDPLTVLWSDL